MKKRGLIGQYFHLLKCCHDKSQYNLNVFIKKNYAPQKKKKKTRILNHDLLDVLDKSKKKKRKEKKRKEKCLSFYDLYYLHKKSVNLYFKKKGSY